MQKNAKFSSAGGSAPRPPCLGRLGALPPNPQPPAAGGFAPKPPASGSWGLCPQTPIGLRRLGAPPPDPPNSPPPIANFWLRAWAHGLPYKLTEVESRTRGSRPRSRTAFPRTDSLEAKDRNARGL